MSLYVTKGSPDLEISSTELQSLLFEALAELGERRHSRRPARSNTRKCFSLRISVSVSASGPIETDSESRGCDQRWS